MTSQLYREIANLKNRGSSYISNMTPYSQTYSIRAGALLLYPYHQENVLCNSYVIKHLWNQENVKLGTRLFFRAFLVMIKYLQLGYCISSNQ